MMEGGWTYVGSFSRGRAFGGKGAVALAGFVLGTGGVFAAEAKAVVCIVRVLRQDCRRNRLIGMYGNGSGKVFEDFHQR